MKSQDIRHSSIRRTPRSALLDQYVVDLATSVESWVDNPKDLYLALKEVQDEHIFSGFNSKQFYFPVAKPALDQIKHELSNLSLDNLGIPELNKELKARISACLARVKLIEEGIEQQCVDPKNPNGILKRKVPYQYDQCILISYEFSSILDDIYRIQAYKELNKELKDPELDRILNLNVPANQKIIELIALDSEKTKERLRAQLGHEPTLTQVNQNMRLPPYYQSTTWEQFCVKELMSDPENTSPDTSMIIPSFLPLDLEFFRKTRDYPIYPMGLINFEHLYADAFKHTPKEFAIHDLKHAWDMQLFNVMAVYNTGLSHSELYDQMHKISNYFDKKLNSIKDKDPELYQTVVLLLFELLHEEGHSLELGDIHEGLHEKSMYGNFFLDRMSYKLSDFNFFGDESKNFRELSPRFQEAVAMIEDWTISASEDLKIEVKMEDRALSTEHNPEKTKIPVGEKISQSSEHITLVKRIPPLSMQHSLQQKKLHTKSTPHEESEKHGKRPTVPKNKK